MLSPIQPIRKKQKRSSTNNTILHIIKDSQAGSPFFSTKKERMIQRKHHIIRLLNVRGYLYHPHPVFCPHCADTYIIYSI